MSRVGQTQLRTDKGKQMELSEREIAFLEKIERLVSSSEMTASSLTELKQAFQSFKAMLYPKLEDYGRKFAIIEKNIEAVEKKVDGHIDEHKEDLKQGLNLWLVRISGAAAIISLLGVIGLYLK